MKGVIMQEKTKKYIYTMVEDLEVQLNTVEGELRDVIRTRRKLQRFLKKIFMIS